MLYPYRPSAAKNQYRPTIGTLWPATAPEVVAGFDRRLGDYFLQVIDERNDMFYTSLQEPLLDWTDIATLRTKVAELGLRLPAKLVDEVEGDGRRRAQGARERDRQRREQS